jgi:hypothetical protein
MCFWPGKARVLFYRLPVSLKARVLNGLGYTPGFNKSSRFFFFLGGEGGASVLYTKRYSKIAVAYKTAWRFVHEDLVKTIFFIKFVKRA